MKGCKSSTVLMLAAASSSSSCAMAFVAPTASAHSSCMLLQAGRCNSMLASSSASSTSSRVVGGMRRSRFSQPVVKRSSGSALQMMSEERGQDQVSAGGFNLSGDAPFEIRGFSLATAVSVVGVLLTVASFAEYFSNGGAGLSGLGFVYGIPVSLVGLALKYAELVPVDVESSPAAEALFNEKATETMKKIKLDVTRHRYGDEAHLDTTVKALGLVMPQKDYPQLLSLKEEVEENGELGFSMIFQSFDTPFKRWVEPERIKKYNAFFGPGIEASVVKVDSGERKVAIKLVTVDPSKPSSSTPNPNAGSETVDAEPETVSN